jgi:hypothetical protein
MSLADNRGMQPMDPNDEEKQAGDFDTPFSLPDDATGKISSDHPATDDKMDSDELYNEGLSVTAGADESGADDPNIISYDPEFKEPKE